MHRAPLQIMTRNYISGMDAYGIFRSSNTIDALAEPAFDGAMKFKVPVVIAHVEGLLGEKCNASGSLGSSEKFAEERQLVGASVAET